MINLPSKISLSNFTQNLPDLNVQQLGLLLDSISLSPQNLVGLNINNILKSSTNSTFTIRLLKWVEPYTISGEVYSLFYTEVDHNFAVGDRIFIEGGVYDSDNFFLSKGYGKGVDGYKVLYVDRTKIVLDILYTGQLPTNEEEIGNFVKVYVASSQYEFDFYSQMVSMRRDSGNLENRFSSGLNNFLYLNGTFSITPGLYGLVSFSSSTFSATSSNLGNSFVVRGSTLSGDYFLNITSDVLSNVITPYLNSSYTQSTSGFLNLEKLRIMNSKFTSGGTDFINERIYFYDDLHTKWKVDKTYLPTIVTQNHFRAGVFAKGSINGGLIGQHEERLSYEGDNIKWNLGTTLNVDWKSGVLDSTVVNPNSFFTVFDRTGLPQIRSNSENNGGAGYNYIFNTDFTGGDVINGNIFNMSTIIGTNSATQSVLSNYYSGTSQTYSVAIKGGVYYNSDISFATISNSTLISSYAFNSYLTRCKSVNSEIEASVFDSGTWISDRIVKIQAYEESNIELYGDNYKMYKFYVTDTNWRRLREFQNFYIDGLKINLPSDELLNFFDDKLSLGFWTQSVDEIGGKLERKVLMQLSTKEENRNSPGRIVSSTVSLEPNFDNTLPSIDLFISGGQDFNFGNSASYPRPFLSDTIDISEAYILDSDFISGLFTDSRWVSGNYFNFNSDYSFSSQNGYTASFTASQLSLTVGNKNRQDILGTNSDVSSIAWVNGLWYSAGQNLVDLPSAYKVTNLTSGTNRTISLQSVATVSNWNNIPNFINSKFLVTPGAKNRWNYVHPVKFEKSEIVSGIFRRAYFEECTFRNEQFNSLDKDLLDIKNNRRLLISDVILDGDSNTINSGIFQYSHKISGNDSWLGGFFHRSVWNGDLFTYSTSPTASNISTSVQSNFRGGVFRNSTWESGVFENGQFFKNKTNLAGFTNSISDTRQVYYYDGVNTRWTWKKGEFLNGDFERSNFETGTFKNGNFFDSDWFIGESLGGNFGKDNIPFTKTRIWQGTFSDVNVINANFKAGNFLFVNSLAAKTIHWNSGIFRGGVFGVYVDQFNPYNPSNQFNNRSTWVTGNFLGGDFADSSEWKGGEFNGGRFLSFYWYQRITPFENNLLQVGSFSWQGGKFNGGQFGTGETGTNSTWYDGEFNGGTFKGRFWKNGLFTRGEFLGSGTHSTDIDSYNKFIVSFHKDFYGWWNDGFVSKVKDDFVKDEKIFTQLERVSTKKIKSPSILFEDVLWNFGTFSSFDGVMENCVWLGGNHKMGDFNNSVFNPYINLALPISFWGKITPQLNQSSINKFDNLGGNIWQYTGNSIGGTLTLPILDLNRVYYLQLEVLTNSFISIFCDSNAPNNIVGVSQSGIFSFTFSALSNTMRLFFVPNNPFGPSTAIFTNLIIYPGTVSGFRTDDSTIWENGLSENSDFYYSKWQNGKFRATSTSSQGRGWGMIWQNGINEYMTANNILWEKGTWRNGNWNGSPFIQVSTQSRGIFSTISVPSTQTYVYPGFASDILNNVRLNSMPNDFSSQYLHLNNIFTQSGVTVSYYHTFNNTLYTPTNFNQTTISLPTVMWGTVSNNLGVFGNGTFKSGVLENVVWNQGWREDNTLIWSDGFVLLPGGKTDVYRLTDSSWSINLNCLSGSQSGNLKSSLSDFSLGDKVSIGNIVSIDLNGNRRLIRSALTVVEKGQNSLRLTFEIGFPIRNIEKDSSEHLIYISKNVWLNGVFLNGTFRGGVWNNGLVQGFPYITKLVDVEWIDGRFKGGRFRGLTNSYDVNKEFHTGLIQRFDFSDENVSGKAFEFKYNSWIDVNFYLTEGVNINKTNTKFANTPLKFTSSFVENNFYGYPTKDVLESDSVLRNGYDLNSRTYRLGVKYKEYTSFIDFPKNIGQFVDINQGTYQNTGSDPIGEVTAVSGFGIDNLEEENWVFKYGSVGAGFATVSNTINTNHGNLSADRERRLLFSGGNTSVAPSGTLGQKSNFTFDLIDNISVNDIEPLRYCFIQIDGEHFDYATPSSLSDSNPIVFYNNYPSTYSIAGRFLFFNGSEITIPLNQINSKTFSNQREYFFNKRNLELSLFSGSGFTNTGEFSLGFDNIKVVETDMIPFFQFATDCFKKKTLATWDQIFIDWENVKLVADGGDIEPIPLAGDPTWENLYLVNEGAGCISYVNRDIQVPYVAVAPDIEYVDTDFEYISSVNITIAEGSQLTTPVGITPSFGGGGIGGGGGGIIA